MNASSAPCTSTEQKLKTKLIETKRELALKRQECRKLEQHKEAAIELHARRVKDVEGENRRLMQRLQEVEGKHKDEYKMQFNTVHSQLKDEKQQRMQKEHQLKSVLAKNKKM